MKYLNFTIGLFLLLYSDNIYAQGFLSFDVMISLTKCKQLDCFSDYVTEKGFSYAQTHTFEHGTIYRFQADDYDEKGLLNQTSILFYFELEGSSISFRSASKSYYLKFNSLLKEKGYQFVDSDSNPNERNAVRYWYRKGKYGICITTDILSLLDGRRITSYDYNVQYPVTEYWGITK